MTTSIIFCFWPSTVDKRQKILATISRTESSSSCKQLTKDRINPKLTKALKLSLSGRKKNNISDHEERFTLGRKTYCQQLNYKWHKWQRGEKPQIQLNHLAPTIHPFL